MSQFNSILKKNAPDLFVYFTFCFISYFLGCGIKLKTRASLAGAAPPSNIRNQWSLRKMNLGWWAHGPLRICSSVVLVFSFLRYETIIRFRHWSLYISVLRKHSLHFEICWFVWKLLLIHARMPSIYLVKNCWSDTQWFFSNFTRHRHFCLL